MFKLLTNGVQFEGWESVTISRSIETVSGSFNFDVSQNYPLPIAPGQTCELFDDNVQILRGYADKVGITLSATGHLVSVTGRDISGDLVDCSTILNRTEWKNATLEKIVSEICGPFGITVRAGGVARSATFDLFALQPGETAWEAIERASRLKSVLCYSDILGGVILARAGGDVAPAQLVEGKNVLSCNADFDQSKRFSEYVVGGQRFGDDNFNGAEVSEPEGKAFDREVSRYRPIKIIAEGNTTSESAQARAEWEATVRASRALRVTVQVQGFAANGKYWAPNQKVQCNIPTCGMVGEMLVVSTQMSYDNSGGSLTVLELARADAFTPKPVIEESDTIGSVEFFKQILEKEKVLE